MNLSWRLSRIAQYVKEGSRIADIGSDHALLPVFLVQSGKAVSAIAGEVNKGPYESARKQVIASELTGKIDVRLGDGLSVVRDGEVDTVCIAGMGGALIASILEQGLPPLHSVKQLVLQPNVGEFLVRNWLYKNSWELKAESILKEDGVIYEILYAERGNPLLPYQKGPWSLEEWFELGPYLWGNQEDVYIEKWRNERDKVQRVLHGLQKSQAPEAEIKKNEIEKRLMWVEEVLKCMQTDKP